MKKTIIAIAPIVLAVMIPMGILTQSWLGFFIFTVGVPAVFGLIMWGTFVWFDFVDRRF